MINTTILWQMAVGGGNFYRSEGINLHSIENRSWRSWLRRSQEITRAWTDLLFVLRTGTPLDYLPRQLGHSSISALWRPLRAGQELGMWPQIHFTLLGLASAGRCPGVTGDYDATAEPFPPRTSALRRTCRIHLALLLACSVITWQKLASSF